MANGSSSNQDSEPMSERNPETLEEMKARAMADVQAAEVAQGRGVSGESGQSEEERIQITRDVRKQVKAICSLPFVSDLSEEECDCLAEIASILILQKGQVLIEQGKRDDALYVLIRGRLQVNREITGGGHVTLACIREGEMAGEMGFLDGSEHSATLQADDTTEVLYIKREHLEGLLDKHPQVVYKLMRAIAREVHQITKRMNMQYVEMTNYINRQHGRY